MNNPSPAPCPTRTSSPEASPAATSPASDSASALRLSDWALISAQGPDAAAFLHGQLTQDVLHLTPTQARLAAYCTAKGRMLASFIVLRRASDCVWLLTPQETLAATLKRLRMFVLRAQVSLTEISADWAVWGLLGPESATESGAAFAYPAWVCSQNDPQGVTLGLPCGGGLTRAMRIQAAAAPAPAAASAAQALWDWAEVHAGLAWVRAAGVEAFVPQMLNYESLDGVNFKKGCYPGQEVVARSQFRGTLKRRTYLAHSTAAPSVGADVWAASDPTQPCGVVLQWARAPGGGYDALVALQVSAFEAGDVHLAGADGPRLQLQAPPYPLLADV